MGRKENEIKEKNRKVIKREVKREKKKEMKIIIIKN